MPSLLQNTLFLGRNPLRRLEQKLKGATRIWGASVTVMMRLIIDANHSTGRARDVTIYRGEVVTSYARLAKVTGLGLKTIRNVVAILNEVGELEAVRRAGKGASAGTVYRIVLYDTYDQSRRKGAHTRADRGATSKEGVSKEEEQKKYDALTDAPHLSADIKEFFENLELADADGDSGDDWVINDLTTLEGKQFLSALHRIEFDLRIPTNLRNLEKAIGEHDLHGVNEILQKVIRAQESGRCNHPAAMFHEMIKDGLYDDEANRLFQDGHL